MDLFSFDPGLVVWTWVVFAISFLLLSRFAFPGILQTIKKREQLIAQAVTKAAATEKRLSEIEKEGAEIIKRSKAEASEILRQSRLRAEDLRRDILKKAHEEARDILEQIKAKVREERLATILSLKSELADFVCDAAEKVVAKSFVSKDDRKWVEDLVKAL